MKFKRGKFSEKEEQIENPAAEVSDSPPCSESEKTPLEADTNDLARQENCTAVMGAELAKVHIGQNEESERALQEQVLHAALETELRDKTIKKVLEKTELTQSRLSAGERFAEKSKRNSLVYELLDWSKYILLALAMGLIITGYIVQRNEVVGVSMDPTLKNADRVWVQKISKLWDGIERGDVVTVNGAALSDGSLKQEDLVKRVIAVAGDLISISDGQVFLNGQRLDEPYLAANVETYMPNSRSMEITIAAGQYFVMGDNRGSSKDSRYFGPINADAILGEVWFRSSPLDRIGFIK